MNKIAFVGNLYHKKTLSSDFFQKFLSNYFKISYYYGFPKNNLKEVNFEELFSKEYETIIFWQVIPNMDIINKYFKTKNLVFIPMYDNTIDYKDIFWLNLRDYKFINFSKVLHNKLRELNINSLYLQYAMIEHIKIEKQIEKEKYKLFFWQRRDEITWNELKKLINPLQIESIHIHKAIDPNMTFVMPSQEDIKYFNITFSDWFNTKEDYINKIKECDIYVSPRLYEGIGMSFLEAMALGKCVMAPNFPTMNEYIVHNKNGLLYDIKDLKILDLSKANELGFNAYQSVKNISNEWKSNKEKIIDFILTDNKTKGVNLLSKNKNQNLKNAIENLSNISFFKNPLKKYRAYKNMMRMFHIEKEYLIDNSFKEKKKIKILIFFPHNPFLLQNGVQTRFFELIKYFYNKGYVVDILSHSHFVDKWDEKHLHHQFINQVYLNDFQKSKIEQKLNNSILPNFAFSSLKKDVEKLQSQNNYDFILMSYVHWANILKDIKNVKKYIMIEDFISMNNYERNSGNYNIGESINQEIERINIFDKAICISKEEINFFERVCKNTNFYYLPHFLEDKSDKTSNKNTDLVFVGSDNPFNKDGMIWFLDKVMPILGDKYIIKIIGKVNQHLEQYKNRFKNIQFINYVENLDDIYKKSKISICPLQGGTGLKIKVVESLSYGVPVVTTKYGIVGMDSKYNGCLVEDNPKEFASSIELLLNNENEYTKYQKEAQDYFIDNFSKESVYKKLDEIFVDE